METESGNVQENRYDVEDIRFELLENGERTGFVYHNGELLHEERWIEMKRLFKAVRQNDFETVKRILDANPELINCVAVPPPKKDDGLSLLQVANKVNCFEIAHYLIDKGIDVNYMEPDHGLPMTQCFTCPVLIDAVRFLFPVY